MNFSNAELMLMQLICESPNRTGYEINNWVKKLGYNRWAGVGKTSVYNGLSKLISNEYLTSHVNVNKTGKGPLPTCYNITQKGKTTLKQDMLETIQTARERDKRFDLIVSAIHLLSKNETVTSFTIRKKFLSSEHNRLSGSYEENKSCFHEGGMLLVRRMLMSIENDLNFADLILDRYSK
ncbi:MAG: PadR family transcriptional regulator [Candidatus Cloacimonetes bacterium]|jgi:DNA-binding PadR family transcriptional regulator|nr:PadR family transcriptional regulator [Candidatus Cloacimonadota bacterium]MBT4334074.1 PadR family transcriptional regulator [Candidatus Cloacimonadota bacterium]MBT4575896.1 PadR family transcriptional regulator [Candidatus Cloacimonadota bacterium]